MRPQTIPLNLGHTLVIRTCAQEHYACTSAASWLHYRIHPNHNLLAPCPDFAHSLHTPTPLLHLLFILHSFHSPRSTRGQGTYTHHTHIFISAASQLHLDHISAASRLHLAHISSTPRPSEHTNHSSATISIAPPPCVAPARSCRSHRSCTRQGRGA